MGVVRELFAGRGPADLALDFGADTITLLAEDAQAPQGWSPVAVATLGDEDFADQVEAMRTVAAERSEACAVDLWLPEDQVLNTHLELKSAQFWNRVALSKAALADRTGLAPDDINIDLTRAPGEVWAICAVEAKVADEARDYARRWGFAPGMVTTRYADAAFSAPPDLTGRPDRRPLAIGLIGAAAAACLALGALAWPSPETPVDAPGPERIAMAPAAALPSPPVAEGAAVAAPSAAGDSSVAVRQPAAPEPGQRKPVALAEHENDFAATILSPTRQFPDFLSVDFSLPQAEATAPIFANVAYRAPSLGHDAPLVGALEQYFPGAEPEIRPSALPLLSLGDGADDAAATPSDLGAFDVAALGPAPRALRTEDLIVESEEIASPEGGETPAEEAQPVEADAEDGAGAGTEDAPDPSQAPVAAALSDAQEAAQDEAQEGRRDIIRNARDPRRQTPDPEAAEAEAEAEAEDDEAPGPGSVVAAPSPGKRPDSLDMSPGPGAVAAAPSARTRPKSIKPKPKAVARNTSSAKTVRAPSRGRPTGRGLASVATLRDAIALDQTSLLGVFGAKNNRRALLRMADGRMKRVSQGEVVDGWVISRIQATSMRMTRGSEVRNLKLIR